MAVSMKNIDRAFHGVSHKAGMQIWRMQSKAPVLLPTNEHGRFFSGDTYIVLRTKMLRSGALQFDLHFWLGKDSSQDEAVAAALKAIELDAALGGRAVQYKEVQGRETDLFLSSFRPCFIPREGTAAAGHEQVEGAKQKPCLYLCRGIWVVRLEQVPFTRSSLSHTNVFILDTGTKIFQFSGESSSIKERARALDVVQYINDNFHDGKSEVIVIDDGRLGDETNTGQFWGLFGGFAPLSKKRGIDDDQKSDISAFKLFRISAGGDGEEQEVQPAGLRRDVLESSNCYVLDCGYELYLWMGRKTTLEQRKAVAVYAEKLTTTRLPGHTHITKFVEGSETAAFRSKFDEWPLNASSTVSGDARFTALLKQQHIFGPGSQNALSVDTEPLSTLDSEGKIEIWQVTGNSKTSIPPGEHGKFFSGNCFLVQYTYPGQNRKEEVFIYSWLGQHSSLTEQKVAEQLSSKMAKGRAVVGRVYQGKEHPQFLALFAPMIVLQGFRSPGHNPSVGNRSEEDTSTKLDIILFEVRGSGPYDMQALQVNAVAGSLNSSKSFILQTESKIFIWHGSSTNPANQKAALKVAESLKPGTSSKILKEGFETPIFWKILEGKRNHASIQESEDHGKDPRLFVCTDTKGKMFLEILSFTQDDLMSDDVFILDAHLEVFVWVGRNCTLQQKSGAPSFAQTYIDHAVATDGLSPFTPLYQVAEGHEPPFFTKFFSWNAAKASELSDSYHWKLGILQGHPYQAMKLSTRRVSGGGSADPTAQDSGVAPDSPSGPSQRAVALAGLSNVLRAVDEGQKEIVPRETEHSASTQRATAMAALSSAWNSPSGLNREQGISSNESSPGVSLRPEPSTWKAASQRAAAVAALSSVFVSSPEQQPQGQSPSGDWVVVSSEMHGGDALGPSTKSGLSKSDSFEEVTNDEALGGEFEDISSESPDEFFPLSRLKVGSTNPAPNIDATRRESYLKKEEFEQLFGMSREQFYELPQWKQAQKKKKLDLF